MSQPSEDVQAETPAPAGKATHPASRASLQAVAGGDGERGPRAGAESALPPGFVVEESSVEELLQRVTRLERRIRMHFYVLALIIVGGTVYLFKGLVVEDVIVRQKLMESRELTLLDNDGNARLFLRMYSRVPVLQIMDSNGKPRMSLGLRFDDTPFLDLSDARGRTRATLEMTEDDAPALRLFDANGNPTFNIN